MAYSDPGFHASAPGHKHGFDCSRQSPLHNLCARWCGWKAVLQNQFQHSLGELLTVAGRPGRVLTCDCTFYLWTRTICCQSFVFYLLLWLLLFPFILSWGKHNTRILFLPWGCGISQVAISFIYTVTETVGVETYYEPFLFNFSCGALFTAMIIDCALCVTLPMSLLNCLRIYKDNTLEYSSVYEATVPFISPCLLFILSTARIVWSPEDILEIQSSVFFFMVVKQALPSAHVSWLCVKWAEPRAQLWIDCWFLSSWLLWGWT